MRSPHRRHSHNTISSENIYITVRWSSVFSGRIYDKQKQGFISTEILKEILREIDTDLTEEELEDIVAEVDEDNSGTVDFSEFMNMMTGNQ